MLLSPIGATQLAGENLKSSANSILIVLDELIRYIIFFLQHPGNIAVDDFNGGRLIFYDFGMMGRFFSRFYAALLQKCLSTILVISYQMNTLCWLFAV